MKHLIWIYLLVVVVTLGNIGFNVFSGIFIFVETLVFATIVNSVNSFKATSYLADKYDKTRK